MVGCRKNKNQKYTKIVSGRWKDYCDRDNKDEEISDYRIVKTNNEQIFLLCVFYGEVYSDSLNDIQNFRCAIVSIVEQ